MSMNSMGIKVDLTQVGVDYRQGSQDAKNRTSWKLNLLGDLETLKHKLFNIPQLLGVVQQLQF